MRLTVALVMAVCVLVVSTAAQQSAPRAVATVKQLHETLITPFSDALFDAEPETLKDERSWAAVRNNALILAESGNLLMLSGRAKDNGAWMTLSRALVDAAAAAAAAADARKAAGVTQAADRIVATCEGCHQPYRDAGRKMK